VKPGPLVRNLVAYQCAWMACVIGAAQQRSALAMAVALAALLLHLATAALPARELALIIIAALVGTAFESVLLASGWVRMKGLLLGGSVPVLMVALWAAFATTLNVALRPLRERPLLCAALAAAGAPLAYYGGSRLGALEWVSATPALLLISAGWALLLPLLMRAARHFDGFVRA
jgi:hypothetical protein